MTNCSALPAFFLAHVNALAALNLETLAAGHSAALQKVFGEQPYSLRLLRELAAKNTVGTFVVIEHESCFEVCNIGQNADAKLFYNHCKLSEKGEPESKDEIEEICDVIRNKIAAYHSADLKALQKYDENIVEGMIEYRYITYSYLQRVCIGMAAVRNGGGTEALKKALERLCESGELLKVSQAVTEKLFDVSGKVYDYSALIAK